MLQKRFVITDPLSLKNGWIVQTKGIQNWPSVSHADTTNLLGVTQPDSTKRLESDREPRKACRYFSRELVREIDINELNKEISIYILKCKVIPSQRIISKPYIWLIGYKNKPNKPGGYINSANYVYCWNMCKVQPSHRC